MLAIAVAVEDKETNRLQYKCEEVERKNTLKAARSVITTSRPGVN